MDLSRSGIDTRCPDGDPGACSVGELKEAIEDHFPEVNPPNLTSDPAQHILSDDAIGVMVRHAWSCLQV